MSPVSDHRAFLIYSASVYLRWMRGFYFLFLFVGIWSLGQLTDDKNDHLLKKCAYWDSHDLDSLRFYIDQLNQPTTVKAKAYHSYFSARLNNDSSRLDQFLKAIDLGIEAGDLCLSGLARYRIGRINSAEGKYDEAMEAYRSAHELLAQASDHSYFNADRKKCVVYTSQAYISNQANDYEQGIEYSLASLRLAEEHQFDDLKLVSYLNLSASYGELSSPDNRLGAEEERNRYGLLAKQYMFRAARLAESIGDQRRAHRSYGNIGTYYTYEDQLDSAFYYIKKAISIGVEIDDKRGLVNDYNMLSLIFRKQDQMDEAERESTRAMSYAREIDSEQMVADILLTLGELSLERDNTRQAKNQLLEAKEIAKRLEIPKTAAHALNLLSEIAIAEGNWQEAYNLYRESIAFRDSIASQENFNRIEELRTKYESEKKEQQIVNLEQAQQIAELSIRQQRALLIISAFVLVSAVVIGYSFYRNRTLKMGQQKLLVEQKLLRSQMNPHFLFNALSSIHAFIFKGDKRVAADYLTTFSELTRDILDHSSKDWITLDEEIRTLEKYLAVQQIRFPNVRHKIRVEDIIEADNVLLPPMLIQPFVENAFEHGLKGSGKGHIDITLQSEDEQLQILIQDDGAGLETSGPGHHTSKAISITRDRLALLFPGHSSKLSIQNREDISGVLVSITIPKREAL